MNHRVEGKLTFKYPEMREELLHAIRSLADVEYQRKAWVKHELPPPKYDCFDFVIHFIYDDTRLAEDPEGAIGLFVKDEQEVQLIKAVVRALERVFDALGMEATDEEYISSREWSNVLEAASQAWYAMKDDKSPSKVTNPSW